MVARAIYLDSCCFIELAKAEKSATLAFGGAYLWPIRTLLRAGRDGHIKVYTSLVTLAECYHADGCKDEEVQRLFRAVLSSGRNGITPFQADFFVMERARDLQWKYGINMKPLDLIHVATAIEAQCTEFVTWDGINKPRSPIANTAKIEAFGLHVVTPDRTNSIPDVYKQQDLAITRIRDEQRPTQ